MAGQSHSSKSRKGNKHGWIQGHTAAADRPRRQLQQDRHRRRGQHGALKGQLTPAVRRGLVRCGRQPVRPTVRAVRQQRPGAERGAGGDRQVARAGRPELRRGGAADCRIVPGVTPAVAWRGELRHRRPAGHGRSRLPCNTSSSFRPVRRCPSSACNRSRCCGSASRSEQPRLPLRHVTHYLSLGMSSLSDGGPDRRRNRRSDGAPCRTADQRYRCGGRDLASACRAGRGTGVEGAVYQDGGRLHLGEALVPGSRCVGGDPGRGSAGSHRRDRAGGDTGCCGCCPQPRPNLPGPGCMAVRRCGSGGPMRTPLPDLMREPVTLTATG